MTHFLAHTPRFGLRATRLQHRQPQSPLNKNRGKFFLPQSCRNRPAQQLATLPCYLPHKPLCLGPRQIKSLYARQSDNARNIHQSELFFGDEDVRRVKDRRIERAHDNMQQEVSLGPETKKGKVLKTQRYQSTGFQDIFFEFSGEVPGVRMSGKRKIVVGKTHPQRFLLSSRLSDIFFRKSNSIFSYPIFLSKSSLSTWTTSSNCRLRLTNLSVPLVIRAAEKKLNRLVNRLSIQISRRNES